MTCRARGPQDQQALHERKLRGPKTDLARKDLVFLVGGRKNGSPAFFLAVLKQLVQKDNEWWPADVLKAANLQSSEVLMHKRVLGHCRDQARNAIACGHRQHGSVTNDSAFFPVEQRMPGGASRAILHPTQELVHGNPCVSEPIIFAQNRLVFLLGERRSDNSHMQHGSL